MDPRTLQQMNPTEQQLKNRMLATETPTQSKPGGSINSGAFSSGGLDASTHSFNPQTILDTYKSAKQLTNESSAASAKKLESEYSTAVEDINISDTQGATQSFEGQKGFAQMPVALNYMQISHDKRIRDLTKQKNELLLSNDIERSRTLSDLILKEETAISDAKTNFLNQYFAINSENRASQSFETPGQKSARELTSKTNESILALAQTAPDAGILPTDNYTTALEKYRNSGTYKRDVREGEAKIRNTEASTAKILSEQTDKNGYTPRQLTALTKLNENVSKNSTYIKTSTMRTFGDNVINSLSFKSGVGDIAAINQFQKVIDEGAVTRDQDVKLIQGAQSLVDSLKLKVKKLQNGDQLSDIQRGEIQQLVEKMYESQIAALMKDPYIAAKNKEAELYGLGIADTILGDLSGFALVNQSTENQSTVNPPGTLKSLINGSTYQGYTLPF